MCNTSPGTVWIVVEREGEVRGVGRDPLQSGGLLLRSAVSKDSCPFQTGLAVREVEDPVLEIPLVN